MDNDNVIKVVLTTRQSLTCSDEENEYIIQIDGQILEQTEDEEDEPVEAGSLRAYLVQRDRMDEDGRDFWQEVDAHSHLLLDAMQAIIDVETSEYRETIDEMSKQTLVNTDVLVLDLVAILPDYRGRGLGLVASQRVLDLYGSGCGVAVTLPCPLQHYPAHAVDPKSAARMRYDLFTADEAAGRRKISRHWKELGFKKIPDSEYMVLFFGLDRPTMRDLLGGA